MISTIEPSEIRETEAAMPVLMRFEKDYLEKHAPGKHNQQNHAGGRSGGFNSSGSAPSSRPPRGGN